MEWENLQGMKDQERVQQEMHNNNLSPPDPRLLSERRVIQKESCHQQRVSFYRKFLTQHPIEGG